MRAVRMHYDSRATTVTEDEEEENDSKLRYELIWVWKAQWMVVML